MAFYNLKIIIQTMGAQHQRQLNPNMEVNLNAPINQNSIHISDARFLSAQSFEIELQDNNKKFAIPQFKRLIGWELELEGISGESQQANNILQSSVYFRDKNDVDVYVGSLLGLKQICNLNIFQNVTINIEKSPFSITIKQSLPEIARQIDRKDLSENIDKFINLLIFLSKMLEKTKNLYIEPSDIVEVNGLFYLRSYFSKEYNEIRLIIAYITWLYQQFQNFEEGLLNFNIIDSFNQMNVILKQIYHTLKNEKIDSTELISYLTNIKSRNYYLAGNFDSFHACFKSKKIKQVNSISKEWILAKRQNEIYFYNIQDNHVCQCRVIRKKRKVPVQNVNLVFNSEDFQVIFMLEGTKNIVKISQFQLENNFTISDIAIKYKFPFKLRNPMIFLRGRELYLLDQMVFRYSIDLNKIYQQSKKINDSLYLAASQDWNFILVRLSIDIFRRGIKIYIGDNFQTLYPSGNPQLTSEIESIKMDIKYVQFCLQIYKNIYLMFANNNLWILDLNFMCFFSFAPNDRLREYNKGKNSLNQENSFVFQILNQPFPTNWFSHHNGINISIKDDIMHVIGSVMGKMFYLQYRFIFQAGLLKLINYRPLFNQQKQILQIKQTVDPQYKDYQFNIYNENLQYYKQNQWLHRGAYFLEVTNIKIISSKAFSQVLVETEQTLCNLKQIMQENKKMLKPMSQIEITLLLFKIFSIYHGLCKNNIPHKNFNVENIWITKKKQMKLSGWSEPPKNWHVSDYKDFLLVCFNVITQNCYDKLTDKIIQKHETDIKPFPFIQQKLQISLRVKLAEKKIQIQKSIHQIKQNLHRQLFKIVETFKSHNFIFSFQKNTPRFSMVSMTDFKIKKMTAIIQSTNNHEQFTFKQKDFYVWDDQRSCLYIFTSSYQMFQIKINTSDYKDQVISLEQFEYLPHNIVDCSFISSPQGLFAFGGIGRSFKKKVVYNKNIYIFNRQKLTWIAVAELHNPRINPYLTLSQSNSYICVMGGELDLDRDLFQMQRFDPKTSKLQKVYDLCLKSPFNNIGERQSVKIFQISERYNIFVIYSVNSTSYSFNIFSNIICGFQINVDGKIYLEQNDHMPQVSMALTQGCIHFLRPYGKYTKINMGYFQNPSVNNKTLYSN